MKKLVTFLIAALTFYGLQAQNDSPATRKITAKKLYLQTGGGGSSRSGGHYEISLQGIINNKWSATFSYHEITMNPNNLPADYRPETGTIFLMPYTREIKVNMKLYSLTVGKCFPMSRSFWFTTEAGLSIVYGQKASFKPAAQVSSDPIWLLFFASTTSSNYSTSIENKSTLGGMFRADFTWAFLPFMGIGGGLFANVNSIQSPVGYQLKLTLGAMRRHIKAQKKKSI